MLFYLLVWALIGGAIVGGLTVYILTGRATQTRPDVETSPPIAVAKEEPRAQPVYRYDPVTRKPTRRLP